jgi:peptidoglycan/LPS O-acetylase OafA/YrhL
VTPERRARVWRWVAIVLLVALCGSGLNSARDAWPGAATTGQRAQTAAQVIYSVAGLLAAVALAARWAIARRLFRIFAIAAIIAAGLAPVVWGETAWWTGAVAAVAGAVLAWVIWLAFVRGERAPAEPAA